MHGGKTRIRMRLKDAAAGSRGLTIAAVTAAAMKRLESVKNGETVSLTVHALPQSAPRFTYNAIGYLPGTIRMPVRFCSRRIWIIWA